MCNVYMAGSLVCRMTRQSWSLLIRLERLSASFDDAAADLSFITFCLVVDSETMHAGL